jgi:tRNA (cmo5U34)-methyltransferase
MQNQKTLIVFDQERAAAYDQDAAKFAPLVEALHFLIRLILADLPADARILCVGAGTGTELINLAQTFPQWHFTAVEPAAPMLDICRQRAEECGIASRCTFHEGYLDSLPATELFDASTCLVVSHFIMQREDRRNFFSQIAARLRLNGYLISSDLSSDPSTAVYQTFLKLWLERFQMSTEQIEKMRPVFGQNVAVLPATEVESIIGSSGFDQPVLFFQTLLLHAWYAKRT